MTQHHPEDKNALTRSFRNARRSQSLAPLGNDRQLEQLRDEFQQRFRDLPGKDDFLNFLLQNQDCFHGKPMNGFEYEAARRKIDRLANLVHSPSVFFRGEELFIAEGCTLRKQPMAIDKSQPFDKSFEQKQKDIEIRKEDLKRYTRNGKPNGYYYTLNHFVARDREIQVREERGMRLITAHVWNLNFSKAEAASRQISSESDKKDCSLESAILRPILKGFSNIQILMKNDPELDSIFCRRKTFQISTPLYTPSVEQSKQPQFSILAADLSQSQIQSFKKLATSRRVQLIRQAVQFLTQTCERYKQAAVMGSYNAYFLAMMEFLGNTQDRRDSMYSEIIDIKGVWLVDQFIFAHRFISDGAMDGFRKVFRERIEHTPNLINIALCDTEIQKKFVMQNYLDQTSDLELVANLAIYQRSSDSSPCNVFIDAFKQVTRIEGDIRKLQDFQAKQRKHKNQSKPAPLIQVTPTFDTFFMRTIDFKNMKINPVAPARPQQPVCSICTMLVKVTNSTNRKEQADDIYIECLKCHHGGHSRHLMSWFQKNQRCPKSDCICMCN